MFSKIFLKERKNYLFDPLQLCSTLAIIISMIIYPFCELKAQLQMI